MKSAAFATKSTAVTPGFGRELLAPERVSRKTDPTATNASIRASAGSSRRARPDVEAKQVDHWRSRSSRHSSHVMMNPEITKKTSTPMKPPGTGSSRGIGRPGSRRVRAGPGYLDDDREEPRAQTLLRGSAPELVRKPAARQTVVVPERNKWDS